MTNNNIKESFDDIEIKNINRSSWFRTMEHYPKTVGHMKLLVSIVDKIGIFDKFDLTQTSDMDSNKLNIIYAVLRIMNKVFNGYLDYVVKRIFRDGLKEIFPCTHLSCYDLFFDQLTQDIDHFICSIIKSDYLVMNAKMIKNKFTDYLRFTFDKTFYQNMIKKLSYNIGHNFYVQNEKLLDAMSQEFMTYTKETLTETYDTMKIFLDKIFDHECSEETLYDIITALKKHIDLKSLFIENCMEIDIYCEQKLDDEMEWFDHSIYINHDKLSESDEINTHDSEYFAYKQKIKKSVRIHENI